MSKQGQGWWYMCNMHQPQGGGFNHWAGAAKQRKDFCETGPAAFWCADRYIKCTENTGLAAFLVHRQVQCTPSAPKYLPCTMQISEISTNITVDKGCHLLPKVSVYCKKLPKVTICCQRLLFVAKSCKSCQKQPKVTICCQKLPFIAKSYHLLPKVSISECDIHENFDTNECPNIFVSTNSHE